MQLSISLTHVHATSALCIVILLLNVFPSKSMMNVSCTLQKEYAEAKVEYEVALKLDPSNEIIKDNLIKLDRAWKSAS